MHNKNRLPIQTIKSVGLNDKFKLQIKQNKVKFFHNDKLVTLPNISNNTLVIPNKTYKIAANISYLGNGVKNVICKEEAKLNLRVIDDKLQVKLTDNYDKQENIYLISLILNGDLNKNLTLTNDNYILISEDGCAKINPNIRKLLENKMNHIELTDEWTTIGEVTNWDNNKTLLCKKSEVHYVESNSDDIKTFGEIISHNQIKEHKL